MASELQIDVKDLVSYYEKIRLKFLKKCEYFNCIRRLDNDEDELKHMRDCHKRKIISNKVVELVKTEITPERELMNYFQNNLKSRYSILTDCWLNNVSVQERRARN